MHNRNTITSKEAQELFATLGLSNYCTLRGGITAWKKNSGNTIKSSKAPISIMRQVLISIEVILFIAALLTHFASANFLWLWDFFTADLILAEATGICTIVSVLKSLPYNRSRSRYVIATTF